MKISYNVTGAQRKALVEAINKSLVNTTVKYLGAPSFAYEVGGFTIDKTGTVTGSDCRVLVGDLENNHGFVPVTAEYDLPISQDNAAEETAAAPTEETTPEGDGFVFLEGSAIEMPLEGHTDETIANLEKLIASKAGLIKKALGVETLTVEKDEHKLRFPWFSGVLQAPEFTAYAWFISALCGAAKEQKRVTAKEKPVDNEKFTFRVFLIRLGFVGDEYKAARKILLRNLSGNSAFRNGAPPKANESEGGSDE